MLSHLPLLAHLSQVFFPLLPFTLNFFFGGVLVTHDLRHTVKTCPPPSFICLLHLPFFAHLAQVFFPLLPSILNVPFLVLVQVVGASDGTADGAADGAAVLGANVELGANVALGANVELGFHVTVGAADGAAVGAAAQWSHDLPHTEETV